MLYSVKIIASDIQVSSADNGDEAENYARSDAQEFYADWNYLVSEISPAPAGAEATTEDDELSFEVTETDEEDGLYTFDVEYDLVVEADSEEEASDKARFFYSAEKYGPTEFDGTVGPKALDEIVALTAGVPPSDVQSIAYHALCKMSARDPAFRTIESIMDVATRGGDKASAEAIEIATAHLAQQAAPAP